MLIADVIKNLFSRPYKAELHASDLLNGLIIGGMLNVVLELRILLKRCIYLRLKLLMLGLGLGYLSLKSRKADRAVDDEGKYYDFKKYTCFFEFHFQSPPHILRFFAALFFYSKSL